MGTRENGGGSGCVVTESEEERRGQRVEKKPPGERLSNRNERRNEKESSTHLQYMLRSPPSGSSIERPSRYMTYMRTSKAEEDRGSRKNAREKMEPRVRSAWYVVKRRDFQRMTPMSQSHDRASFGSRYGTRGPLPIGT